jgi:hypothetical protein
MSVIGKMSVQKAETFDKGQAVELSVVCADALMAHYHPENENVAFTRYSPSGSATLHFDKPVELPKVPASWEDASGVHEYEKPCELYLIYSRQEERPSIEGAAFFAQLRCASRTEYGTDHRMIELCTVYHPREHAFAANEARLANLKLGIDNPPASNQFEPGTDGWWVVAYRADQMTMEEALAHAHAQ